MKERRREKKKLKIVGSVHTRTIRYSLRAATPGMNLSSVTGFVHQSLCSVLCNNCMAMDTFRSGVPSCVDGVTCVSKTNQSCPGC